MSLDFHGRIRTQILFFMSEIVDATESLLYSSVNLSTCIVSSREFY